MERILRFNVNGQEITRDPTCNFAGMVPGTFGYITAEFIFSKEWDDCIKVVGFRSGSSDCEPKSRQDGRLCVSDDEVLK